MQQDFRTAKAVFRFIEVIGWIMVVAGLILAIMLFSDNERLPSIIAAGIAAGSGLVLIAGAQIGRAQIATAENTAQIADLLRKSGAPAPRGPVVNEPGGLVKKHKGRAISRNEMGEVNVDGKVFSNVRAAENAIDNGLI